MKKLATMMVAFLLFIPFASIHGNNVTFVKNIENILYVGGSGPNNYTSIQDAINAAENGYTIYVYPKQYNESIVIKKSISLIGIVENGEKPVIDGEGKNYAVNITADGCTLKNFKIVNHGNFDEDKPGFGIKIAYSNYDNIINNIIICNFTPFFMRNSSYDIISGNTITGGSWVGIQLFLYCYHNTIIYNNVSHNPYAIGIDIAASSNNTIAWNIVTHNMHGVDIWGNNNNISYNIVDNNHQYGISIGPGSYNKVLGNEICNNGRVGLLIACVMEPASWNVISYNNISFNGLRGIYLLGNWPYLSNNTIYRNIISYNGGKGIYLYWMCKDNVIEENNFIGNNGNAGFHLFDRKCHNTWNTNYWDDWYFKFPKPIFGSVEETKFFMHRWLNFDFHPAMEPYKI